MLDDVQGVGQGPQGEAGRRGSPAPAQATPNIHDLRRVIIALGMPLAPGQGPQPDNPDTADLLYGPDPVMQAMLRAAAHIRLRSERYGEDGRLSEEDEKTLIIMAATAADRAAGRRTGAG